MLCLVSGGPGSSKGTVVNDLKAMFGFAFISAEDLILQNLPLKAEGCGVEPINNTHGLADVVKENPEYLTLDWVLEIVLKELQNYPTQPILVDLIPNLKFMMRVDGFIKKCDKEMEEFEKKVRNWFRSFESPGNGAVQLTMKNSHIYKKERQSLENTENQRVLLAFFSRFSGDNTHYVRFGIESVKK